MKGRPITTEEFERMPDMVSRILTVKAKAPHANRWEILVLASETVESWKFLLRGLWWSGLRLGEALNLTWDDPQKIMVDLTGKRPMLHIPGYLQKSGKDQLYPVAPEFAEFLRATPETARRGRVFHPISRTRGVVSAVGFVSRVIGRIGKQARVKVATDPRTGKVKYASAHDLRRSFGERWSSRVMPKVLREFMRHQDINTSMRYYVGRNANTTADAVWVAYEKSQEGTVLGTVAKNKAAIMSESDSLTHYKEST